MNSSKKLTNEFVFTTIRHVSIHFLEEIEPTKKAFQSQPTFRNKTADFCISSYSFNGINSKKRWKIISNEKSKTICSKPGSTNQNGIFGLKMLWWNLAEKDWCCMPLDCMAAEWRKLCQKLLSRLYSVKSSRPKTITQSPGNGIAVKERNSWH